MHPYLSDTRFWTPAFAEGRARLCCLLLGLWPWFDLAVLIGMGWGEIDIAKQPPFGRDFISFYAASNLVLAGHAADVYVVAAHEAVEHRIFSEGDYSAFFYPPLFLLICAPLAKLPFFVALSGWLATSMTACVAVLRRLAPPRLGLLPLLAFPGVFMTIAHGQNAFLTTALMGGALLVLERRPVLAGILFGALAFKPHFGLLVPVFLLASGRWRALFAAGTTVLLLALISLAAFGAETWHGFLEITSFSREVLEQNRVGYEKMQSVFAMVRLLGGSVATSYAAQGIIGRR
jgi:alpha-1,2-mannosyltransferase